MALDKQSEMVAWPLMEAGLYPSPAANDCLQTVEKAVYSLQPCRGTSLGASIIGPQDSCVCSCRVKAAVMQVQTPEEPLL